MVRVRPPAPPRPVKRERVDQRPAARIQMKVVEGPQHRLGMRTHRRRIRPSRNGCPAAAVTAAPMRPGLLPGNLQPPGEIAGLGTSRPIPSHPGRPQEPEPPEQVHPIGTNRGLRPARRQQIPEESRGAGRDHPVSIDQPVRLVTITRRHHPAIRGTASAARSLDGSSSPVMTPDHARKNHGMPAELRKLSPLFSQQVALPSRGARSRS